MGSMRYVAMQILTWGTVAGAAGSALLLAALGGAAPRPVIDLSLADATFVAKQPRPADQAPEGEPPPADGPEQVGKR